ncbi:asparaginase [Janibacter hoylei PVAS-1]|uniref:Asparaginase n=1 Tax=Janibacter hoylei PVAS-1 TaxID=1210046 RepID=K1E6W8_9MICO|nr:asparaginase [Janibacter hoylei]EKA61177.1 asparaginase [Janibacter hoylei PVAS-1]RWU82711.1 asparaginase [Janibacter hoylei PVAS-1]
MTAQAPDTTALDDAPVLVHVTRGGFVESAHRATLVATDPGGGTPLRHGRVGDPVLPRSSLKPIQALAMVRHGLDLPPHLLALVCSSHSAEQVHREGAAEILATVGLDLSALRNTPALPLGELEHARWLAGGRGPEPVAQDCSGKHAGMLATCRVNDWPTETYLDPEHPLQQAIRTTTDEVVGEVTHTTVDGCGAPLFAVPLRGLAASFGRLAAAEPTTDEGRVADAMRTAPHMVGGTDRDVTQFMQAVPGLIAKDGAESVYAAGLADGRGVAVKVADGAPFSRARRGLLAHALLTLGVDTPGLRDLADQPVLGHGRPVGAVEVLDLRTP